MSETLGAVALIALLFVGMMFIFAMLGTLIGMFIGLIISITPLAQFVENGFLSFGVHAQGNLVSIGAALGFVSGFFGGAIHSKSKED